MTSDPAPDQPDELDGYLQRAELLAELGRYDEATAELGFAVALAPGDLRAQALLARVHLAAGRPAEALAAAESVLTSAGTERNALRTRVVQGLALADLRRFGEAAQVAEEILRAGPADAYALRSGAAILAESRNGQQALNAAWRAAELAPGEAETHLVLSLVSARLGLFDLAERAYRAALDRDPELAEAARDVGVIRLERRRYAASLEAVAESIVPAPKGPTSPTPPPSAAGPHPSGAVPDSRHVDPASPDHAPGAPQGDPSRPLGASPLAGPAPWPAAAPWTGAAVADGLRRLILYGAGYAVVAAVSVACVAAGNPGLSRVTAALAAIVGAAVLWVLAARTPKLLGTVLPALLSQDRMLAFAGYAALAGPVLILVYALVGTPWPLVLAIAATAVAELVVLRRGLPPPRA